MQTNLHLLLSLDNGIIPRHTVSKINSVLVFSHRILCTVIIVVILGTKNSLIND